MSSPTVLYFSPEVNAVSSLESHSSHRCVVVSHCFNIYGASVFTLYMGILSVYMPVHNTVQCPQHRGQKIASDRLELVELQMFVSYHLSSQN